MGCFNDGRMLSIDGQRKPVKVNRKWLRTRQKGKVGLWGEGTPSVPCVMLYNNGQDVAMYIAPLIVN